VFWAAELPELPHAAKVSPTAASPVAPHIFFIRYFSPSQFI
jgi:hypothetical protein